MSDQTPQPGDSSGGPPVDEDLASSTTEWADVAQDAVRGAYQTVWRLIDRERLGAALVFMVLSILGAVALVLALKMPAESIAPVLEALLEIIGQQWAAAVLAVSLGANAIQSWNRRRIGAIMQREIDRQAAEKRELQVLLVPQLEGRSSNAPVLEPPDDD